MRHLNYDHDEKKNEKVKEPVSTLKKKSLKNCVLQHHINQRVKLWNHTGKLCADRSALRRCNL